MINRELLHVYNEAVRFATTKFTAWSDQQVVVIATDPGTPDLPTLQASGVDQAVDLLITPPTQNVHKETGAVLPTTGFPVNDLREYVIYFSTSANIDSDSDGVPDSYDGSFTVEAHNTKDSKKSFPCTVKYYFVATCGDKHGNVSVCSTEVNATPIASGYAPSVVDYGNNIEQVYEGCGIIALKLQPPKSDWEKGGGYIVYFDEKTSGGSWPSPATWTYLYHGPGPIVLHKQLEADSGSGDFRLYKYKVRVFAQGADLTNVTGDSQLSLDNTSGEVTTGTIDDGVASAGYDPSQTDNAALIAETVIAEKFLGNEFVGQTFAGGIFRSTNWGASAGSEFDASAGTLKLGGSSAPKFSVAATGVMTATEGNFSGAVTSSSVTITGGTLNINSGVFSVSAAGAVVASSISCTNLAVGAGSTWGGNALGTAYIPDLDAAKITTGTLTGRTVRTSSGTTRAEMANTTYPFAYYYGGDKKFYVDTSGNVYGKTFKDTNGQTIISNGLFQGGRLIEAGVVGATGYTEGDYRSAAVENWPGAIHVWNSVSKTVPAGKRWIVMVSASRGSLHWFNPRTDWEGHISPMPTYYFKKGATNYESLSAGSHTSLHLYILTASAILGGLPAQDVWEKGKATYIVWEVPA